MKTKKISGERRPTLSARSASSPPPVDKATEKNKISTTPDRFRTTTLIPSKKRKNLHLITALCQDKSPPAAQPNAQRPRQCLFSLQIQDVPANPKFLYSGLGPRAETTKMQNIHFLTPRDFQSRRIRPTLDFKQGPQRALGRQSSSEHYAPGRYRLSGRRKKRRPRRWGSHAPIPEYPAVAPETTCGYGR